MKYQLEYLRSDIFAGVTVALILIPQSMAYAQLAGLPPFYGLYASCFPPLIAAIFGSSRQLSTGPVAIVSLMTAAALEPLAVSGTNEYIFLAIFLALVVGVIQVFLGLCRLGFIVNFLSYPVIIGFTNAAALIIATSQLGKLLGIHPEKGIHHYETVLNIFKTASEYVYWPTILMGVGGLTLLVLLKKTKPEWPNVLIVVILASIIAKYGNYEDNRITSVNEIHHEKLRELIVSYNEQIEKLTNITRITSTVTKRFLATKKRYKVPCLRCHSSKLLKGNLSFNKKNIKEESPSKLIELHYMAGIFNEYIQEERLQFNIIKSKLHNILLRHVRCQNKTLFFPVKSAPENCSPLDNNIWRIEMSNNPINLQHIKLIGRGEVVGTVPKGLPKFSVPYIDMEMAKRLFSAALIISFLGYMEAISIAKALAARTGQKLDSNKELIGQGLANIFGSFFQSYPVSGSFSRTAVNYQAGGVSALSSVFTSVCVILTLLFFTPLLYHLPQTVLAAIVINAVLGLIHFREIKEMLRVFFPDGIICLITFIVTLYTAPHLDKGIILGVCLSFALFLYNKMRPSLAELSLAQDNTYRDAKKNGLALCRYMVVIRINGPLFFANLNYIENEVVKILRQFPRLKVIIFECSGLSYLDISAIKTLELLCERLIAAGFYVSFSSFNERVLETLEKKPDFFIRFGNTYPYLQKAIDDLWHLAHRNHDKRLEPICPLKDVVSIKK